MVLWWLETGQTRPSWPAGLNGTKNMQERAGRGGEPPFSPFSHRHQPLPLLLRLRGGLPAGGWLSNIRSAVCRARVGAKQDRKLKVQKALERNKRKVRTTVSHMAARARA